MKNILWKTSCTFLLSVLTTMPVSAQNDTALQSLNESSKQKSADLSSKQANAIVSNSPISEQVKEKEGKLPEEKPLPTEETKTKKKWSSPFGGALTNYFLSDSHLFFSEQDKSQLETSLRPGVRFSYKNSPVGINGLNRKTNRNSQTDDLKTLDAVEQPI